MAVEHWALKDYNTVVPTDGRSNPVLRSSVLTSNPVLTRNHVLLLDSPTSFDDTLFADFDDNCPLCNENKTNERARLDLAAKTVSDLMAISIDQQHHAANKLIQAREWFQDAEDLKAFAFRPVIKVIPRVRMSALFLDAEEPPSAATAAATGDSPANGRALCSPSATEPTKSDEPNKSGESNKNGEPNKSVKDNKLGSLKQEFIPTNNTILAFLIQTNNNALARTESSQTSPAP